ncbi:MAG: GNAT family N-acetyltransferase [Candidatus Hodarchaeota archaeon]
MSNKFFIRRAKIDDAKAIHKVLLAAFEEFSHYYSPEGFNDTVISEETAKDRIKEMNVYIAANENGELIGTISWQKVNQSEAHIRGMGVIPSWQGKNSPAKSLLQHVELDARKEGCIIISLDTTKVLKKAQRFYEKNGYKKTGKTGDFFGSKIYEFIKQLGT